MSAEQAHHVQKLQVVSCMSAPSPSTHCSTKNTGAKEIKKNKKQTKGIFLS